VLEIVRGILHVYRVFHKFGDDIATYVSLNWLEISKFPLDMMYPYWWTTHMQKMSPLSILGKANWSTAVLEISLGGDKVKNNNCTLYFYFDPRI
jgi:hypothetical protein